MLQNPLPPFIHDRNSVPCMSTAPFLKTSGGVCVILEHLHCGSSFTTDTMSANCLRISIANINVGFKYLKWRVAFFTKVLFTIQYLFMNQCPSNLSYSADSVQWCFLRAFLVY